ncbi:MAG: hypothetical protein ACN6OO_14520, partial [Pseudomonas putida]
VGAGLPAMGCAAALSVLQAIEDHTSNSSCDNVRLSLDRIISLGMLRKASYSGNSHNKKPAAPP